MNGISKWPYEKHLSDAFGLGSARDDGMNFGKSSLEEDP